MVLQTMHVGRSLSGAFPAVVCAVTDVNISEDSFLLF